MNGRSDPRLVQRLSVFASAAAGFAVVAGLSALAGWKLHIAALDTWVAAPVKIVPNAAACLVLLGVSLWLQRKGDSQSFAWIWIRKLTAKSSAVIVCLMGLLSLAEHFWGWDLGLDRWLVVVPPVEAISGVRPGLMATIAALNFLVLGSALLLLDWKTRHDHWPAQFLSFAAAIGAIFGLFALVLQPRASGITMALPAAVTFFVIASGLVCSRATWAVGGLLTSPNAGARLLRSVVPAALLVLGLTGWSVSKALLTEAHFSWGEASLLAILCGALLVGFVTWIAFIVDRSDALNAELERRVAERTAALGESEGRLAGVIQAAMDAIITVDEEQNILLFNAAAEKMFRCPAAETLGRPIARFIPQRFHAAHARHIKSFGETGVTTRSMGAMGTLWAVRADGEELQAEASISQIEASGKKMFTVILRDVTERKRAEEARERLAAVIDSSDDAIIGKTLDGTITSWNSGAEKVFGYSSAEAVGKPLGMLLPPDRAKEESDILVRIGRGESIRHFETVRLRKDGRTIDVSVTISPIRNSSGAIVGASKIARDVTERKRVEEALRQSDARRKFALETAKVGDWELDLTTLQATRSLLHDQIFGYPSLLPEWSFDIFLRHVDPDDRERVRENFGSCASQQKKWEFECRIVCPNGDIRWIWACGDHCKDSSGRATHMFGIVQDITERKRVEEALREQAQVMESAQVFVRDLESRVVFWPRGAERLYGFNSQEALGILSHDLLHTQFPEPLEMIEKKLFETGVWEGELIHRRRDGSTIVVSSAWMLHRDNQGRPLRILETNIDITTSKQAAEKLAGQAEKLSQQAEDLARSREALETQTLTLQSVLDSMAEGLAAADEQGKFVLWNTAAERILGIGATDLPSQQWTEHYGLFLNDTVTPFPSDQIPIVRAIRGEVSTTEMFVRNPKIAEGAWIEVCASPLKDKRGMVRGGVAAFRDITRSRADEREIRKLNEELEIRVVERTAQLEAANHELEAFSYSVSHDLRAPLRHISGFSQMLVEEFGPTLEPDARHYLDRIQAGTQKMGVLVDELLHLARVGRHALRMQPTKLNSVVAEVLAILQPESAGRQVEWMVADLPTAECDPVLVKQIFQNLLANALKFTRPRAHAVIEVSCREEDGQPVFMVRDNGIGFSMKYVDKLFGVFQRLHRAEDFEGTGIGLATVQRIVHKHGGRVWAEAELDKGAAFYFTLGVGKQAESKSNGATAGGRL